MPTNFVDPTQYLSSSAPGGINMPPISMFSALTPMPTVQQRTANEANALIGVLPYLTSAMANSNLATAGPYAQEQLRIAQQTSPQYAQLMQQLVSQYLPGLNQAFNQIGGQNMLAGQQNINNMITGAGAQTVGMANQLQQFLDPQFYRQRAVEQGALENLINSIKPTAELTPTERNEISQGLARQNAQAGTLFSPSQTNTLSNAMQYGNKGFERLQANRSALSQALNSSTAFLPASKSGIDAMGVATAGAAMNNPANSMFTGITQGNIPGLSNNLAGSMFGDVTGQQTAYSNIGANMLNQNQDVNAQKSMQHNQLMGQMFSQMGGMMGGGAGGAQKAGACCFIFMEAYKGKIPACIRKIRDKYYKKHPRIAFGYTRMSRWLVPLMRKSNIVRNLVWYTMINPATKYASNLHNGINKRISHFWLRVWAINGR